MDDCDCDWDARKMLDKYIHDYMIRKNMHETAEIFAAEANVCPKSVSINPPEGFLTEWWSLFWDLYSARQQNHDAIGGSTSMAAEIADRTMPKPIENYMLPNVFPTMSPRPELNPNMLPNVFPTMRPRPELNPNMLPNVFPTMSPRPELNPNILGSNPFLDPISGSRSQTTTNFLAAKMSEQSTSHILDIEQIARMLPSSSRPSLPQKNVENNFPIPLATDNRDNIRGDIVPEKTPLDPKAMKIKEEPASSGSSTSSNSTNSKSGSASDKPI